MIRLCSLAAILLCATAARATGLRGSELNLVDQPVDLNVRKIEVPTLFEALAKLQHRDILVDECANRKTIDIKVMNAPVPLVFDALAAQAGLEYHLEGNAIRVQCAPSNSSSPAPAPAPPPRRRVLADLRDTLQQAFPRATDPEIDRAIATLESQLGHD